MIDIHSHIIWGLDDGSKDIEMSEQMAKSAFESGISDIIATPHFRCTDEKLFEPTEMAEKIEELNNRLIAKGINIKIHQGMELFVSNDLPEMLSNGNVLSLANSRYILMEFAILDMPFFAYNLVHKLVLDGYRPIIAHPERNKPISSDIGILKKLIDMGCYVQMNKGSILGDFGSSIQKTALSLLEEGLVHCIATDMHNTNKRNPSLFDLTYRLSKIITKDQINILLNENPNRVLQNSEKLISLQPNTKEVSKMKWWKKLLITACVLMFFGGSIYYYIVNKSVEMIMENLAKIEIQFEDKGVYEVEGVPNKNINENYFIDNNIIEDNPNYTDVTTNNKAITITNTNKNDKGPASIAKKTTNPSEKSDSRKFSEADKIQVMKIVYGKISSADIASLKSMAIDGFTASEMRAVRPILKSFSSSEISELKSLYNKYSNNQSD